MREIAGQEDLPECQALALVRDVLIGLPTESGVALKLTGGLGQREIKQERGIR